MAKKIKLQVGSYDPHGDGSSRCARCKDTPYKIPYGDDTPRTRAVGRVRHCGEERQLIEFSVGLQRFSSVFGGYSYVARWCTEHFNFHVHLWHHLKKTEKCRESIALLDSLDDLKQAHATANAQTTTHRTDWVKKWEQKRMS